MRRTTLLALLAAAAVGGWIALFEREEPTPDAGEPVFDLDEAAIRAIEIERPGDPVVRLTRDGEGFAVAEDAGPASAADSGEVDLLLQNVDSLRFEREIEEVDAGGLAAFGLAPPGLAVRVFPENDPPGAAPLAAGFGDETPAAGNRYLVVGDRVLVTSAFARDNFDLSAWDLRDKRIFRLDTPAARRLRLTTNEGTTVEIARNEGVWRIVRPFRFAADPYEASQFASRLLDAAMTGVAPEEAPVAEDSFGLDVPRLTAELHLVAGTEEEEVSRTVHFGGASRTPPGVFARVEADPLVFVVGTPLFETLREGSETELAGLRSLDLFGFAGFQAVALRVESPDGITTFQRREGEEGREWTMVRGDDPPVVVDTVAVEDLLYRLNSTEAEDIGGESLPATGAAWTIAVTEAVADGGDVRETEPETVRLRISAGGEVRALRGGDERTLALGAESWRELTGLLAAAQTPPEES
jgi:hypothetical protein